jgi:hypothetical protein
LHTEREREEKRKEIQLKNYLVSEGAEGEETPKYK